MGRIHAEETPTAATALSPERLAQDFGAETEVTQCGVQALCDALHRAQQADVAGHVAVLAAWERWKTLFGRACGRDLSSAELIAARVPLAMPVLPPKTPKTLAKPVAPPALAAVLFALHTYYALLVKMLVGQVTACFRKLPLPLETLLRTQTSDELCRQMQYLENGGFAAEFALDESSGGDMFSWYTAAWSDGIEQLIRQMAAVLVRYDPATAAENCPLALRERIRVRAFPCPRGACEKTGTGTLPQSGVAGVPGNGTEPVPVSSQARSGDMLKHVYLALLPRSVRHELGEYYTPDWLADHVLDAVGFTGQPAERVLDPACGSGTFLVAAIRRIRARHAAAALRKGTVPFSSDENRDSPPLTPSPVLSDADLCRTILTQVVGYDINPVAVLAARANYLIALGDLLRHVERIEVPVVLCDSILDGPATSGDAAGQFDFIVGNPPWIAWDNLPAEYRQATRPLWQRYGLFSLSGSAGRHGGGKKDLSMLMAYVSADRYLKHGGRLGLVLTQTLFQTKGAGDGFRRFRLGPDGDCLKVLGVDDMVAIRPFDDTANRTSVLVAEKGAPTQYPVPYVRWLPKENRRYQAEPIDAARPGSPWFLRPEGLHAELTSLIGPSDYTARLGANSGGANGVYWVTPLGMAEGGVRVRNLAAKGRHGVDTMEAVIEPDLLYPLLRWGDVAAYRATPSAAILLAQDVATRMGIEQAVMERDYPQTLAYLRRFEPLLQSRAAYRRYQGRGPFYSMYNVGPYTVAPIKVVWRRMDRRIRAAVLGDCPNFRGATDPATGTDAAAVLGDCPNFRGATDASTGTDAAAAKMGLSPYELLGRRPAIPQETCVLIAADSLAEAHYMCAVLNSAVVNFLVAAHSVGGGKGFGTPSMLDFIELKRFDPHDRRHEEMAALSRQAHAAAANGHDFAEPQHDINRLAAELWRLTPDELAAIEREMR